MSLILRLFRGCWAFGIILADYLIQLGLARVFRRSVTTEAGGRRRLYPGWVKARRKRVDERNAKRALAAMLRLRGVYIKLGQVLSVMGGFLPRPYIRELEKLQDDVPPHSFAEVEKVMQESFGQPPDALYQRIEREPLAAASLGQVHIAYLQDGSKVAVKILYPRIRDVIQVDMRVVALMLRVYKWFVPISGIESVHSSLVDLLRRETDYLHEAQCMSRMAKNFEDEDDILFPEVVTALTTRDVLTMTFMDGVKITKVEALREMGIDTHVLAKRLTQAFYKQIFVDRFFHADPHPGNFLVQKGEAGEPLIVVLDFGAISEARDPLIDGLIDALEGFMAEEPEKLLEGFERMGFVAPGADRAQLREVANQYFQKLLELKDRSPGAIMNGDREELRKLADPGMALDELRELMKSVHYPESWFYVERATVMLFWLVASIDPYVDTMRVGVPYVVPLIMKRNQKRGEAKEAERQRKKKAASSPENDGEGDDSAVPAAG